jgi:hypothetical protein
MERNHQVQLMRSIYSEAERVIAWLGLDVDGVAGALRMLQKLSDAVDAYPNNLEWLRSIHELWTVGNDTSDFYLENDAWGSVLSLFRRPHWKQIWILQETVLARNLWFMCGLQQLEFSINIFTVATSCQSLPSPVTTLDWLKEILLANLSLSGNLG